MFRCLCVNHESRHSSTLPLMRSRASRALSTSHMQGLIKLSFQPVCSGNHQLQFLFLPRRAPNKPKNVQKHSCAAAKHVQHYRPRPIHVIHMSDFPDRAGDEELQARSAGESFPDSEAKQQQCRITPHFPFRQPLLCLAARQPLH